MSGGARAEIDEIAAGLEGKEYKCSEGGAGRRAGDRGGGRRPAIGAMDGEAARSAGDPGLQVNLI